MKGLQTGLKLIEQFEGCRLYAYPDPITGSKPYTAGWGSTLDHLGRPFRLGQPITQKYADDLLLNQVREEFLPAVAKLPFYKEMSDEQVGALLSFCYNVGSNFYGKAGFATITKALKEKAWSSVPASLELYRNPGTSSEVGLLRRRRAEGELWETGRKKAIISESTQIFALNPTVLKKEPTQSYLLKPSQVVEVGKGKAYKVKEIAQQGNHHKVVLDYGAGTWYIFSPHWNIVKNDGTNRPSTPIETSGKQLAVRYFPQWDSLTAHKDRMCFSSSVSMAADYLNPDAIKTSGQEDDYYMINYVFKYGDTVDANAHIKALQSLGYKAQFRKNLTQAEVISLIDKNTPVPVGILHHGPVNAPRGGGHWVCIIGYDLRAKQWIVHDPYGELDVINGGYFGQLNGASMRYSFANFNRRWELDSRGRYVPGNGWGMVIQP